MQNPFDAANLENYTEANHILNWYARLSDGMRQRCVDTIQDDHAVLKFLRQSTAHMQHGGDHFDANAIRDLSRRMLEKLRRS